MNNYNLSDLLMLLASAQGIFLGVLILHKYSGLLANRFLATLMFLHAAILLEMSPTTFPKSSTEGRPRTSSIL